MTYKINGTEITLQPTSGQWMPREQLGINGVGKIIYSGLRKFEMVWNLADHTDYSQLLGFFNNLTTTGSYVVDLPKFNNASTWAFDSYTGCYIREPETGVYFAEHQNTVRLLVTNIRT